MSYATAEVLAYCHFKVKRHCWIEGTYITAKKTIWGTKKVVLYRENIEQANYSPTESDVLAQDWEVVENVIK